MIIPPKLQKGDTVRVIAPARSISLPWVQRVKEDAIAKFDELGLKLTFGKHVEEIDAFDSSTIDSRIEDLHEAFADPKVKLVITVIGGFNSNQLLRYIDYDLIKNNPKILCGYSDITALANAIFTKTGLVTYSGPHFFNFGQNSFLEYTEEYFKKCLFQEDTFGVIASKQWSDGQKGQPQRLIFDNPGHIVIHQGKAEGTIIGGNLCTVNLLQGTEYMPSLENSILFIEDDALSDKNEFDRNLQSLIHQPGFEGVKGVVIGRFQVKSDVSIDSLTQIINTKRELNHIPVIANVDFGHTTPLITFPIGGSAKLKADASSISLNIIHH